MNRDSFHNGNWMAGMLAKLCVLGLTCLLISVCAATPVQQMSIKELQITMLVNYTHMAAQGLGGLLENKSPEEQTMLCRSFVKPIRFFDDQSGYFYIYNMKGLNIAHATQPEKQDQDLIDYKDSKGNLLIQGLIKAVENGGGFVDFWWDNPNTKQEEKKLGYAEPIPGTDFFIGSGIYLGE